MRVHVRSHLRVKKWNNYVVKTSLYCVEDFVVIQVDDANYTRENLHYPVIFCNQNEQRIFSTRYIGKI